MHITIWNEYIGHNRGKVKRVYPDGLQNTIKTIFDGIDGVTSSAVTLLMPEQGITDELLEKTDVLFWWSHGGHAKVEDALADKIVKRVKEGKMGAIFLHSAHLSKPFVRLINATGALDWRDTGEHERVWTLDLYHPIAKDVEQGFLLKHEEMYGEPFDIGKPKEVVFAGWFKGGEIFRSGAVFEAGKGKLFYFQPGHEKYPTYYDKNVRQILLNAAMYVAPQGTVPKGYEPQPVNFERKDCKHKGIPPESLVGGIFKCK